MRTFAVYCLTMVALFAYGSYSGYLIAGLVGGGMVAHKAAQQYHK
jgi:hypothetical protein